MSTPELEKARQQFVTQWGNMGSAWGINRTMAQIQGLLMICDDALTTDDVMEELSISRGNAHTNLKELVQWRLASIETRPGDRKEYFRGEKDPWKLFSAIVKERKRREIEPTVDVLHGCSQIVQDSKDPQSQAFVKQMQGLIEFVEFGEKTLDVVLKTKKVNIFKWILSKLT